MKRLLLPLLAALSLPVDVSAELNARHLELSKKLVAFEILAISQCHENAGNMTPYEANLFAINELRNNRYYSFKFKNPEKYLSKEKVKRAAKKLSSVYQEKNVNCYSKVERDKAEKDKGGSFYSHHILDVLM